MIGTYLAAKRDDPVSRAMAVVGIDSLSGQISRSTSTSAVDICTILEAQEDEEAVGQ
jgi:hypothetical protein